MKKKKFLFSLLMAIVMMAMSPQKMWATADVTWSLGGAYYNDPASGVWVGSSEGGGEQITSGHLYLCFTPAGADSQLNNWITQLTSLSSNSGLDGACVDAMTTFLAANSQWNGWNANNPNFSANVGPKGDGGTGGAFGTPAFEGFEMPSPVTIEGIDVNTAYDVLAIIFDTEEITADSKYVVIKGYGAKDWYMECYQGLLEIGFASEWNDGDIDHGNAAPNNAVDGKWHAVGDHSLTAHPAAAVTCTTDGYSSDCWSCSACGKYFSDAEGKNEIAASSVVIPANHDDVRYDAANEKTYCESCGTTLATGTWIFLDGVNITIATDYDNTGDIMFSNGTMIVKEGATITHGVSVSAGGVLINYGSINMVAYNGGGTIYNHGYIKDYYNYSGENYNTGTYSSLEYPENKLTTCSHTNITPLGTVEATCTKPGGSLYECSTCYYRFVPEGSQIAALGHDLPPYDNGFATCNRCGEEIMQEPQSQDGILKIANLGNLYWFLEKLEKEPDTYNSAHLELTNDIVVNDGTFDTDGNFTATNASTTSTPRAWRKCVEQDRTFYGTVDGQGHEIKGLYFNDSQSYVYLFYHLGATDNKTATITNLGFTNVYCSAKNPPLFCHYNYGTISQCYVNGTIEGNGWSPTAFCYYNYGTISQCYTTGIRKNKDYPSASLCYHNYGTVTNSYSTCNIFGSETYGLIADNYGTITNCYFAGTLSATTNYGLCGIFKSGSSSTNCYTTYPTAYDSSNSAVHPTINTSVSAERLASGEIAYLLNGSQDAGTWRQKLSGEGVNTSPVLKQTDDNKVYYGYADCVATEKTYVNIAHATQGHSFTNYTYNNDAACVKSGTKTASCDYGCGTTDTKDDSEHLATGKHAFSDDDPGQTFCTVCNHGFFRYTASERVTPKTISNLKNASGQGIYVDSQNTWDADTKEGVMEFNEPLAIIGDKAFEQCAFTGNLVIPNSVKSIGNNAFYKCGNLANVAFNSVPLVGSHVFDDCDEEISYSLILTDDSYVYTGNETNNFPADIWPAYRRTNIKNKWGTLVVPFDVLADQEEYDLYSIISVDDDNLTLKRPEGILPAGTPVLIRMSEAGKDAETGKYNLFLDAANETLKTSGTLTSENVEGITLKGSYDVKDITKVSGYIISNNAFWNIQNIRGGNRVYNAPFRAYLEGSTSNCAKMLSIGWNDDEDITAVETLDALTSDEAQYYDINGRRLNDLQQGINIVKRGNKTYKILVK